MSMKRSWCFDSSADACPLDSVTAKVGARIEELVSNVDRFTATEDMEHTALSPLGLAGVARNATVQLPGRDSEERRKRSRRPGISRRIGFGAAIPCASWDGRAADACARVSSLLSAEVRLQVRRRRLVEWAEDLGRPFPAEGQQPQRDAGVSRERPILILLE